MILYEKNGMGPLEESIIPKEMFVLKRSRK